MTEFEIAKSNFNTAIDQVDMFESAVEALDAYAENAADTATEQDANVIIVLDIYWSLVEKSDLLK